MSINFRSNHIEARGADFSVGHSKLRDSINRDLYEVADINEPFGGRAMHFVSEYYRERDINRELIEEYMRAKAGCIQTCGFVSDFGQIPGQEFVYAVEDARWSLGFMPAWYERELLIRTNDAHNSPFKELPESGFVSLAFEVYSEFSACICCPFITAVPDYDDPHECAYFYGRYYASIEAEPEFGFWFTYDYDLIDQMKSFVDMLSNCQLDEDFLIF